MIETARLRLEEYKLMDAPFIYTLMNSEGWLKNIGDRNIQSVEDAEKYMQKNYFSLYEKYGYGPYLVTLKETGEPIGSAGLYKRDGLDHPDIGFAFLPKFWHQGYAFEAAEGVLKFAENKLNIEKIAGIVMPDNSASIRLLERLGLKEVGTYVYEDGEPLLLYSK